MFLSLEKRCLKKQRDFQNILYIVSLIIQKFLGLKIFKDTLKSFDDFKNKQKKGMK